MKKAILFIMVIIVALSAFGCKSEEWTNADAAEFETAWNNAQSIMGEPLL